MPDLPGILIVDDNKDLATTIGHILEKNGYDAVAVCSGKEALDLARRRGFDLVLLDYELPDMNGLQLQEKLADLTDADFIIITAHASVESAAEAVRRRRIVGYHAKRLGMNHLLMIIRQVVMRRKAEKDSRESEERFRLAFENANVGLCLVDLDGRIMRVNSQMTEIFGYSRETLETMTVNDIAHPEDRDLSPKFMRKAACGRMERARFEKRYIHKKGRIVWGQVSMSLVRDDGGVPLYFISYVQDVTTRKIFEHELLTYQKQLRSLTLQLMLVEEQERRNLATALHDSIGQSLALAKMKLGELKAFANGPDFSHALEGAYRIIEQVIADVRTLTFDISPQILYELGLEPAVEWLAETFQEQHGLDIDLTVDPRPKPLEDHVPFLIFRIFRELLMNIIKHADTKKVKAFIRKENDRIKIAVEDDGAGFDPSKLSADVNQRRQYGIFSIRERVQHLRGSFSLESAPGKGCRVTVSLPLKAENIESGRAPSPPALSDTEGGRQHA